jgi:hypothetical protein
MSSTFLPELRNPYERHSYVRSYTYDHMTQRPSLEDGLVEICKRCGMTEKLGNHFDVNRNDTPE